MRYFMLMMAIVFWFGATLSAQENGTLDPLYLYDGTAFWMWTEADGLQQITEPLPENQAARLSPDRRWVAYQVITPLAENYIEEWCPCDVTFATDLWLLNIETGEETKIAGQPDDIEDTFSEIVRSFPVWSPDSSAFAWVEGIGVGDLTIYDIESGKTRTVAQGLKQLGLVLNAVELQNWTEAGIYKLHEVSEYPNVIAYEWHFYDPETGELTIIPISLSHWYQTMYIAHGTGDFSSVNDVGGVLTPSEDGWTLTNLADGTEQAVTGAVVNLYAASAPETSLRILPAYISEDHSYHSPVEEPDGTPVTTLNGFPRFSRDGRALLTIEQGGVLKIYRPDQPELRIELPFAPRASYWGDAAYELHQDGDTVITNSTCEGSRLSLRLSVNSTAWVLGDTPNNIRAEPDSDAEVIGEVAAGDWFKVTDGPRCADGIAWWYVDYVSGVAGWTAEGQGSEYFLQPGCPTEGCQRG
jgi:hypothetical protein